MYCKESLKQTKRHYIAFSSFHCNQAQLSYQHPVNQSHPSSQGQVHPESWMNKK